MNILFYLVHDYSIPIFRPLVSFLITEKKEYDFRFFLSEKIAKSVPEEWAEEKVLRSFPEARKFNPDFVLCAENYLDYRLPGLKVQLFHGVGVEKKAHYAIRHFFDLYLTSGPLVTERFKEMAKHYNYFDVVETGWPKFDHILNFTLPQNDFLNKNRGGKEVILYAPTFSRRMQSAEVLAKAIPQLIRKDEIWLVKFHELMSPKLKRLYESIEGENLKIVRESDITPYLHLADLMISDTSSVVYEFLCLEKPVITFRTIGNPEKGLDIREPEELRPVLDLLKENPDFKKSERLKMLNRVNPNLDGKISNRVFDVLLNIHTHGLSSKRTKPANLFRKAKIWFSYYWSFS